jgi:hypothetical protein
MSPLKETQSRRKETVMQMSDAVGIKHHPVAMSSDLFAVCLVSFLGLAIAATVFQLLAAYDLSWMLTHLE